MILAVTIMCFIGLTGLSAHMSLDLRARKVSRLAIAVSDILTAATVALGMAFTYGLALEATL
jgi:hypothetical protein